MPNSEQTVDLRDLAVFEGELAKCRTSQDIESLCVARAEAMHLVRRDKDGIVTPVENVDTRVEPAGGIYEEAFSVGNRLYELRGTRAQIEDMKANLVKSGIDLSKAVRR